jgi:Arc/MetJ-type ribon-helix-helix transcriptional regulator
MKHDDAGVPPDSRVDHPRARQNKGRPISVRLSEQEYRWIHAEATGSISEFARRRLLRGYRSDSPRSQRTEAKPQKPAAGAKAKKKWCTVRLTAKQAQLLDRMVARSRYADRTAFIRARLFRPVHERVRLDIGWAMDRVETVLENPDASAAELRRALIGIRADLLSAGAVHPLGARPQLL